VLQLRDAEIPVGQWADREPIELLRRAGRDQATHRLLRDADG
jgi:hypothetical protein